MERKSATKPSYLTEKTDLNEGNPVHLALSRLIVTNLKKVTDDLLKHDDLIGDKIAMDALRKFLRLLRSHGIKQSK